MQMKTLVAIAFGFSALATNNATAETKTAIFAGGCFWCMEKDFEHLPGVIKAESGYTGGKSENPTYKTYEKGNHIEAIRIAYDSDKITYDKLLHTFWRSVNPTDAGGQFCDRGHAYSTAIYTLDDEQEKIARTSKQNLIEAKILSKPIVTPIIAASKFWLAENYHQDYYKKASIRYAFYRRSCGRDATIMKLWGNEAHAGIVY